MAIEQLVAYGLKIDATSRLRKALPILGDQGLRLKFPVDAEQSRALVNALFVAHDYADIAAALPIKLPNELRSQLEQSMNLGSLAQNEENRRAYQYQSQFWIGRVLELGGAEPQHIEASHAKSPDYSIRLTTLEYGVEVKRPSSEEVLERRIHDAADQLRTRGLFGAVVLDLTDCMPNTDPPIVQARVDRIGHVIDNIVWDDERKHHRPGLDRIILTSSFARGAFSVASGNTQSVNFRSHSASSVFVRTGTIKDIHATALREIIKPGLFWSGFEVQEQGEL